MKKFLTILVLLLSLKASAITPVRGLLSPSGTFKVVKVYDGDTFTIIDPDGLKTYNIRINGIDAPERTQEYGLYARALLIRLIGDQPVTVKPIQIDIWGRTVALCYNHEGKDIALEMLKAGMAWNYAQYSSNKKYADAERQARYTLTGLWCRPNPMNPQDYRNAPRKVRQNY